MSSQQPDPRPGRYYVAAIDGDRRYFLAGPWLEHALALAQQPLHGEPIKSALGV